MGSASLNKGQRGIGVGEVRHFYRKRQKKGENFHFFYLINKYNLQKLIKSASLRKARKPIRNKYRFITFIHPLRIMYRLTVC